MTLFYLANVSRKYGFTYNVIIRGVIILILSESPQSLPFSIFEVNRSIPIFPLVHESSYSFCWLTYHFFKMQGWEVLSLDTTLSQNRGRRKDSNHYENDDDDGSMPEGKFNGFCATWMSQIVRY